MTRFALAIALLATPGCVEGRPSAQANQAAAQVPPEAVAPHPNEPPGFEVIADADVSRVPEEEGGTIGEFSYHNSWWMTVIPEGNPVPGRDAYIEAVSPTELPTGDAGAVLLTYAHAGYDELYISLWDWVAPDYRWHAADNKRLIVGGGDRMVFSIRGRNSGPGRWFMSNYSANDDFINVEPPPNAPVFERGRWNHTEFILRHSIGEIQVIMNGQTVLHLRDQKFDEPNWSDKLEWLNLYGGTGGNAGQPQRTRIGELYISGRR